MCTPLRHIQCRVGLSSSALVWQHLPTNMCEPDHRTSTVSEQLRPHVRSLNQSIDPTLARLQAKVDAIVKQEDFVSEPVPLTWYSLHDALQARSQSPPA